MIRARVYGIRIDGNFGFKIYKGAATCRKPRDTDAYRPEASIERAETEAEYRVDFAINV